MISLLLPDLRGGGAERVTLDLAYEFARNGHRVEFVLMQARGEFLDEARAKFPVVSLEAARGRTVLPPLLLYLRARRPSAMLVAMWPLTAIAASAVRFSRQPMRLVASEHVDFRVTPSLKSRERKALRWFGRSIYRPCHGVVAVSRGVAESLAEVAGLRRDRIKVIYNPVSRAVPVEIAEADRRLVASWLDGPVRLIAIGSLKRQKGFDVLLRALAQLRQRRDARLLILGEGGCRSELVHMAQQLGVADSVLMPGFRSNPADFLKHADAFVLSSNWEGFGNVVVEALAAGVRVISTDCRSGPAEILNCGQYGHLVPPGDFVSMAAAIENALDTKWDPAYLRARAEEFQPKMQAALYLELLLGS